MPSSLVWFVVFDACSGGEGCLSQALALVTRKNSESPQRSCGLCFRANLNLVVTTNEWFNRNPIATILGPGEGVTGSFLYDLPLKSPEDAYID